MGRWLRSGLERAANGGGLGNPGKVGQVGWERRQAESGKEIVETGERSSGPDGGNEPIGLGEDKASRLCDTQAVAQFRVGVL